MILEIQDEELRRSIRKEVRDEIKGIAREEVREIVAEESKRILDARFQESLKTFVASWQGREMQSAMRIQLTKELQHVGKDNQALTAFVEAFECHAPFRDMIMSVIKQVAVEALPKHLLVALGEITKRD